MSQPLPITPRHITYDAARPHLSWSGAIEALRQGHSLPKAQVGDIFLGPKSGVMLSRGAYVPGLGYGLKSVTVFGGNQSLGLPSVQGAMLVFEPEHGQLSAILESRLVTEFKTAADSVLGAQLLARPDSTRLLIVGAGTVARSLVQAYAAGLPHLKEIRIWARRSEKSAALAQLFQDWSGPRVVAATGTLEQEAGATDILASATLTQDPILQGGWLRPGTHVDLIGAFTAEMREADDSLISGGRLFVDSAETTLDHIGELLIPLKQGVIQRSDVLGDLRDMVAGEVGRLSADEITVFKNGGGAHLDLMTADYIVRALG